MRTFDNSNTQEFTSWDEINPGDELVWWRDNKYGGFYVKYILYTNGGSMQAEVIDALVAPIFGNVDAYDSAIYPYSGRGWKKVIPPMVEYDPNQQGDTEEDI